MTEPRLVDSLDWQKSQYQHDKRNHFDILSLHKNDRLKHYGLHFAKYAGRIARGVAEEKSLTATAVDSLLVSLSAANTLQQHLPEKIKPEKHDELFLDYVSAAGTFCDACEKIDHMEPFVEQARESNENIFRITVQYCAGLQIDIHSELQQRRQFLKDRQFYISE